MILREPEMKRSTILLAAAGALLVAPLVFVRTAAAMPENVCQARCIRHFNPADYPKEERWKVNKQYEECLALCRKSRI